MDLNRNATRFQQNALVYKHKVKQIYSREKKPNTQSNIEHVGMSVFKFHVFFFILFRFVQFKSQHYFELPLYISRKEIPMCFSILNLPF